MIFRVKITDEIKIILSVDGSTEENDVIIRTKIIEEAMQS